MRYLFVLLVGCGARIAGVEELRPAAATWEEECIQREIRCIGGSRAAPGPIVTALLPFAVFPEGGITGDMVVRACKLQGNLCRVRAGIEQRD